MPLATTLYDRLADTEDARLCDEIGDEACREAPRSFGLILGSYVLTKLGDAIASPKTTLAWMATAVGAPVWVLGFLVPIRESGSMVPQLFVGSVVRGLPVRKWVWVLGSLGQSLCMVGLGLAAFFLSGRSAGWTMLALVAAFSLARGFCSVAAKDVMGKTIPKPVRGQLNGWSASAAGLVTVGIGAVLLIPSLGDVGRGVIGVLLLGAAGLWLVGALTYAGIPEYAGATDGGRNALEALGRLNLLLVDRPFRRFVTTRALLMCSALSAPFYVALAQRNVGSPGYLLGAFVAAGGLASLVSAPIWGRFADGSSRNVMIAAALVTAGIGAATFALDRVAPGVVASVWYLPLAYFVLSIAHSGVRVGRKTYVVNLADGNRRTDYVAIGNSVIGVLLLVVGSIGALASVIGPAGVIGVLSLLGFGGAAMGFSLPNVEEL